MQTITTKQRQQEAVGVAWRVCIGKQMLQNRMALSSARISPMALPSHRKVKKYNSIMCLGRTRIFGGQH